MTLKRLRRRLNCDLLKQDNFAWGCLVGRDYRFVYVFGPWLEYQATMFEVRRRGGTAIHKGCCSTLLEAGRLAEQRAVKLNECFADGALVRVRQAHLSILGEH